MVGLRSFTSEKVPNHSDTGERWRSFVSMSHISLAEDRPHENDMFFGLVRLMDETTNPT